MKAIDAKTILVEMENLGTEQARKTYRRHGAGEKVFGVSYADMGKLQKRLRTNHPLALDLWATGIHDAQILALSIADPEQAEGALLDSWANTLTNYVITDAFSDYVAKTSFARPKAETWIRSDREWVGSAGWNLVGSLADEDSSLPDEYFEKFIETIESSLAAAPNRTKHAMNSALISIGVRNPRLRTLAEAGARRIGKVVVDHGLTNCKTPDAISYIQKIVERKTKATAS